MFYLGTTIFRSRRFGTEVSCLTSLFRFEVTNLQRTVDLRQHTSALKIIESRQVVKCNLLGFKENGQSLVVITTYCSLIHAPSDRDGGIRLHIIEEHDLD